MKEESASITTSLEYTHIGDLSLQLLGTHPKSINGLSPLALVKVVYPNRESEEVMMDLVTNQYYVSHGYTLKLDDINIGTSYLPWKRMFSGTVKMTTLSEDAEEDADVQKASVRPCTCETDNNIAAVIRNGQTYPSLSVMSSPISTGIQTMQTPVDNYLQYHGGRNDNVLLAIAALGFVSLGLLGLAFLLSRKRGD